MTPLRLIDEFMPTCDVASRHATTVRASADKVMRAVRRLDFSGSALAGLLFRLRGMSRASFTFDGLLRSGFVLLGERPDQEILLGITGRFWTLKGALRRLSPEEFRSFAEPGMARAVWSFHVEPGNEGGVRLVTETRVACTDAASRRRFRIYWWVVAPFSGWIRREALRLIRRDAESGGSGERAPAVGTEDRV